MRHASLARPVVALALALALALAAGLALAALGCASMSQHCRLELNNCLSHCGERGVASPSDRGASLGPGEQDSRTPCERDCHDKAIRCTR